MIGRGEPIRQRASVLLIGFDRVELDASQPRTCIRNDVHVVKASDPHLGLNHVRILAAPRKEKVAPRGKRQRKMRASDGIAQEIARLVDDGKIHRKAEARVTDEYDSGSVRQCGDCRRTLGDLGHEVRVPGAAN